MSDPKLLDVFRSVNTSKTLEKLAENFENDNEVLEKVSQAKVMVNAEIFSMSKKAALNPLLRKLLTGAAYGTGAAVPAVLGGSYLLGRATDEAKETTADIRNKVLQSALGLAGMGAGLYGLHRLSGGGPLVNIEKKSEDENVVVEELIEKLGAVGLIEGALDSLEIEKLSEEAQKLAIELRIINQAYGVQLLHEASNK